MQIGNLNIGLLGGVSVGVPPVITATTRPIMGAATTGDLLSDASNWVTAIDPANYQSAASGTAVMTVVATLDGVAADGTEVLRFADEGKSLLFTVSDDQGTTPRVFNAGAVSFSVQSQALIQNLIATTDDAPVTFDSDMAGEVHFVLDQTATLTKEEIAAGGVSGVLVYDTEPLDAGSASISLTVPDEINDTYNFHVTLETSPGVLSEPLNGTILIDTVTATATVFINTVFGSDLETAYPGFLADVQARSNVTVTHDPTETFGTTGASVGGLIGTKDIPYPAIVMMVPVTGLFDFDMEIPVGAFGAMTSDLNVKIGSTSGGDEYSGLSTNPLSVATQPDALLVSGVGITALSGELHIRIAVKDAAAGVQANHNPSASMLHVRESA
jgi:hypothetical protein